MSNARAMPVTVRRIARRLPRRRGALEKCRMSIEHSRTRIIVDGAVAGLMGAAVVAVWFLIFDSARGHPFETPALLALAILHYGASPAAVGLTTAQLVIEYSVAHLLAFVAVGMIGALLLEAAEREPTMTASLFIFLGAFEVFFVALVMLLGPQVMAVLTWWGIVVGNLMATAAMLAYFLVRHSSIGRSLLGPWLAVVREGVVAGLIGALTMIIWLFVYDAAFGSAFRTPMLLGAALLGARAVPGAAVSVPIVLGYAILHFGGFIAFGIAGAILMAATEKEPLLALGVVVVCVIFEVFFLGWVTLIDATVLQRTGWWKIVLGNLLALGAMTLFFLRNHPTVVSGMQKRWSLLERERETADYRRAPSA